MNNMISEERLVEHLRSRYTYDAERGVVVNRKNRVVKGGRQNKNYLQLVLHLEGRRKKIAMHHLVWALVNGRMPKQIDHINGITSDNRIENLREVSGSENDANRLFTWKWTKDKVPGVFAERRIHAFDIACRRYYYACKHACFHDLITLGRMFEEESGNELTIAEETEREVLQRVASLKDEERQMVADQLFRFVNYLETVQQMPLLMRLKFYETVVPVYNFLRKNKQLGRHELPFSTPVRMFIHQLMQKVHKGDGSFCVLKEPSPLCTCTHDSEE